MESSNHNHIDHKKCGNLKVVKIRQQAEDDNNWSIWDSGHSQKNLKEFQKHDPNIGPIYTWKEENKKPHWKEVEKFSPATRHYWHLWKSLVFKNGLLFKESVRRDGLGCYFQILTPDRMKNEVLQQKHSPIVSGHLGTKKTQGRLSQRFYWFESRADIAICVSGSDICQANKPQTRKSKAPLGSMPTG